MPNCRIEEMGGMWAVYVKNTALIELVRKVSSSCTIIELLVEDLVKKKAV